MTQKIKLIVMSSLVAVTAVFFTVPSFSPAMAQTQVCTGDQCAQQGLQDIGSAFPGGAKNPNYGVKDIAKKIIEWALYLAAIIAVIFIIIGGFLYITSAGDATRATKGRTTLVNALIGLTIIILSYLIVQIVYNFLTQPR